MLRKFLVIIITVLWTANFVRAQNSSDPISGKVADQNGAAISGAVVKIKNDAQETKTATTDADGEFSFSNLKPGKYLLTAEKTGFAAFSREISSGETNLDLTLRVSDIGATVEVTDETYVVQDSTTAAKTNAPIRDIPQSIAVVNQNLLRDRATFEVAEAVTQNVSGVTRSATDLTGSGAGDFLRLRGFSGSYNNSYLRNGLKFPNYGATETADVERIEVLKGTSSVIYGRSEPGGVVNLVSKQPVSDNFSSFEFTGGQFDFYRPQVDAGGKLFSDKLFYRFNAAFQADETFRQYADGKRIFVAPALLWKPTEKLQINFDASYLRERRGMDVGQPLVNGRPANVSVRRSYSEPLSRAFQQNRTGEVRARYDFNSDWAVQTAYKTQFFDYTLFGAFPSFFLAPPVQADGRTVNRDFASTDYTERWHYSDSFVTGKFATGRIKHDVLGGYEYGYTNGIYNHEYYLAAFLGALAFPTTDIYAETAPLDRNFAQQFVRSAQAFVFPSRFRNRLLSNGVYAQDLITIHQQFKILIGGRFDNYNQRFEDVPNPIQRTSDNRFSPRVGFVYQPGEWVSLYASYGSSFSPQFPAQLRFDNRPLDPYIGEQYEAGVKLDALDRRLSATLAVYNLTFKKLVVDDPSNPGFSVQTGEQRSRGIELDAAANPIRGLNLNGNFAAIEAAVTRDTNRLLIGRFLPNTARLNGNFWATYRFVRAKNFLKNFGIGAGLQAVGRRYTNLANFGLIPGYARVDGSAFYDFAGGEKTQMRFAVNLQNLTNKRYYESALSLTPTAFPGTPLRALFSLKITRR